jgi:hypothetical protein
LDRPLSGDGFSVTRFRFPGGILYGAEKQRRQDPAWLRKRSWENVQAEAKKAALILDRGTESQSRKKLRVKKKIAMALDSRVLN